MPPTGDTVGSITRQGKPHTTRSAAYVRVLPIIPSQAPAMVRVIQLAGEMLEQPSRGSFGVIRVPLESSRDFPTKSPIFSLSTICIRPFFPIFSRHLRSRCWTMATTSSAAVSAALQAPSLPSHSLPSLPSHLLPSLLSHSLLSLLSLLSHSLLPLAPGAEAAREGGQVCRCRGARAVGAGGAGAHAAWPLLGMRAGRRRRQGLTCARWAIWAAAVVAAGRGRGGLEGGVPRH